MKRKLLFIGIFCAVLLITAAAFQFVLHIDVPTLLFENKSFDETSREFTLMFFQLLIFAEYLVFKKSLSSERLFWFAALSVILAGGSVISIFAFSNFPLWFYVGWALPLFVLINAVATSRAMARNH
jgi:hypothetical protein